MNQINKQKTPIILVPCSDRKTLDGNFISSLEALSFHSELGAVRKQICGYYEDESYYFFDGDKQQDRHLERKRMLDWTACRPAYERYTGNMFTHIPVEDWDTDISNILFVSPLWGIIRPTDLIPNYTLEFSDVLTIRKGDRPLTYVRQLWETPFASVINLFANNRIISLLFEEYRNVFPQMIRSTFQRPTNKPDQRGHIRGKWLSNYLLIKKMN